jgi:parallel beta-helix repeat protein
MMCKKFIGDLFKMHKKETSFILLSLFLFSLILESYTMPKVFATAQTLHVPTQYLTIQAAINAANPGDTIQVASRVYNEYVVVNKSVSLIGEEPSNTIIDGSGKERDVVHVTANNVKIEGFTIQNGEGFDPASLSIGDSRGHAISNNIIRRSNYGLRIRDSNDSNIVNNVIANNTVAGIFLSSSNGNNVIGNLIEENSIGVRIADIASKNNTFYHNNFIDNTEQVSVFAMTKWDNGSEGNYWSNYVGQDLNGDGMGDTGIPHLGIDRYPLMEMWSEIRNFSSTWKGVTYHTVVRSNSTVASFNFTYSLARISFNITGPQDAVSFCNVTIGKSFLYGNFTVLVDRVSRSYVSTQNITHTSLYFTFSHSIRKIQIKGTKVVGNPIPTANFTYSPTDAKEGQEIQFNDTSTDQNETVVAWSWNFDDGNTSAQQSPIYRYMKKGTYNATLTVTDNEGATNIITKTIVVSASLPDYTLYYILVGIASGALIFGTALFLLKKKKRPSSSTKITE